VLASTSIEEPAQRKPIPVVVVCWLVVTKDLQEIYKHRSLNWCPSQANALPMANQQCESTKATRPTDTRLMASFLGQPG